MASSTITKPSKQLGELLQQQQEPFVLDLYLIERRYVKKGLNFNSESGFGGCNGNSNKFSKKGPPRCFKILRAVLNKFARNSDRRKTKTREGKFSVNGQEVAKQDWFSSVSSTTLFNSFSESVRDDSPSNSTAAETLEAMRLSNMTVEEVSAGGEFQCQFTANTKQHSPVSVLEQLPSSKLNVRTRRDQENEATCTVILPNKLINEDADSMFSASLCELHFHSDSQKQIMRNSSGIRNNPMELMGSNNSSPQFQKSKSMLQQTRRLLFDCVREIVESHAKEESVKKCHQGFLGPEEVGKLLWEKMKVWGKKVGDETNNMTYLLGLDSFDSAQEWFCFDQEKREICSEIGDSIAEKIVNEFVIELGNCDSLAPFTR